MAEQERVDATLSVVVPVFNEEDSVTPLYEQLVKALGEDLKWEVWFVDDGSVDSTIRRVEELHAADQRVRGVEFRRNYGQTPAMVAGIEHANGEIIVTMDGDLQNDPADIPRFLREIEDGFDIVVGWREKRQDALISRKIPSWIANRLIGRITGVPIRDNGCSLKAYRSSVIKKIPLYSEMHRFIPAMASLAGSRTAEIAVRHHPRTFGKSKYGLKRIYKVVLDLVVVKTLLSMVGKPMKFFAALAALPLLLSFSFLVIAIFHQIQEGGSFVLIGAALLWGTAALFCLMSGLLAELLYGASDYKESYLAKLTTQLDDGY